MINKKYVEEHPETRKKLKVLGYIFLIPGIIFVCVSAGGLLLGNTSPFFLGFIGIPLIGIGGNLLRFGYMRQVSDFVAGEVSPTISRTINTVKDNLTKDNVKYCSNCGCENHKEAKFCSSCGRSFYLICPKCNHTNDNNSKYCSECGEKFND